MYAGYRPTDVPQNAEGNVNILTCMHWKRVAEIHLPETKRKQLIKSQTFNFLQGRSSLKPEAPALRSFAFCSHSVDTNVMEAQRVFSKVKVKLSLYLTN
jgi:hypothetical protein